LSLLVAVNPYGGLAQPTDLPLVCLAVAGVCAALLLPGADAFRVLARWRVAWAFGALATWALISSLFSGRLAGATFGTNGSALGWPVIAVAVVIVLGSSFGARRLRELLVWAGVAVLVVQFGMTMFEALTRTVPAGTLSNSSNAGEVIVVLAPLVFWSGLRAKNRWSRVWRLAVSATALWTLVVGSARVSTVALAFALLVWCAIAVGRRYGRRSGIIAGSALVGAVLVAASLVALKWASLSQGAIGEFARTRWGLWEPALRAFAARPILGFGPDGYQVSLARFGDRGPFVAWEYWPPSIDPHNMLLWFAVSLGAVGVGLAGWIAFEVGRSWFKQSRVDAAIPVGPIATGVVLYAVSALASPAALQTLPIALVVLGASLRPEATSEREMARGYALAIRWTAVVLAVLVGVYGVTRLSVSNRISPVQPSAAQRAADLVRVDPFLYYSASLVWGYAAQQSPEVVGAERDLVAIRRAVALEPSNPFYQLELARTLVSYGAPQADIESAYLRAIQLAPASPEALASYADYLISLGRLQGAKSLLDRAERLAKSTSAARVFAVYYRAIGNEPEAKRYDALLHAISGALAAPNTKGR
jgi:hypothetical protein